MMRLIDLSIRGILFDSPNMRFRLITHISVILNQFLLFKILISITLFFARILLLLLLRMIKYWNSMPIIHNRLSLGFVLFIMRFHMHKIIISIALDIFLAILINNFAKSRRCILFWSEWFWSDSSIPILLMRYLGLRKVIFLKKHFFLLLTMLNNQI